MCALGTLGVSHGQPLQQNLLGSVGEMNAEVGGKFMHPRAKFLSFTFGPAAKIQDHIHSENQRSCGQVPQKGLQHLMSRIVPLMARIVRVSKIIAE